MPPFAPGGPDPDRVVYALQATGYDADKALTHATAMMVEGRYKLTYYFGYKELGGRRERMQLYDIQADPEEMEDLFDEANPTATAMLAALKKKLDEVNQTRLKTQGTLEGSIGMTERGRAHERSYSEPS